MRRQLVATAVVILALVLYGPSCRGGKPVIEFEGQPPPSPLVDAGINSIGDVVTVDSGCATSTTRGQLRPSNLLFVLDRSRSMCCNPPQDGQSTQNCASFPIPLFPDQPSKWDLTREAVLKAVADLRVARTVRVGLTLFPKPETNCTVSTEPDLPITPLDAALEQHLADMLDDVVPGGETPLAGATILSYAYLLDQMHAENIDGETFVVVVTDGYETCMPGELPKLLDVDVPNAFDKLFVRTFVIGAPGSDEGRALLSEFAIAGGTETSPTCTYGPAPADGDCHYDMTQTLDFSTDLLDALTRINSEVMECTIDIPSAASGEPDLQRVNVLVDGVSRTMVETGKCDTSNGWQYSQDFTTIQLCGDTCRAAKNMGAEVTVILGCPTVIQ